MWCFWGRVSSFRVRDLSANPDWGKFVNHPKDTILKDQHLCRKCNHDSTNWIITSEHVSWGNPWNRVAWMASVLPFLPVEDRSWNIFLTPPPLKISTKIYPETGLIFYTHRCHAHTPKIANLLKIIWFWCLWTLFPNFESQGIHFYGWNT